MGRTGHGLLGRAGRVGLLAACLLALSSAQASERDDFVRQLKLEIGQLDGRIESMRTRLAVSPGLKTDLELRLELVEALAERARKRGYLEVELHPDRAYGASQDIPAILADRDAAVALLGAILADQPDHPRCPELIFARSRLQREAGRYEDMLRDFSLLLEHHPKSLQASQALLVLGDYYFDRSDLKQAAEYYHQLLARPGDEYQAQACYKLAWVAINQQDCKTALELFTKVALARDPQPGWDPLRPRSAPLDLRHEALVDMTFCYVQVGRPQAALDYFSRFQMSRSVAVRVLSRLANQYYIREQNQAALAIYRHLLPLAEDPEDRTDFTERIRDLEQAAR